MEDRPGAPLAHASALSFSIRVTAARRSRCPDRRRRPPPSPEGWGRPGRRDDPAHDHDDVGAPEPGSSARSSGTRVRWPAASERRPDDVHVVLDRLARRLLGGLEERADVDVEAEVRERRGDHLLAAVVAVLAHLGHQDPGAAPVRSRTHRAARARLPRSRASSIRCVHAGDRPDRRPWRPKTFSMASG